MRWLQILLLLCCPLLSGQQLQFGNMAEHMPLPSQECYNIMQDSKGYIWLGTEQGFCRYDGSKVRVFDRRNGLPEAAVYSVAEDPNGRLWLATSKNRILILENGKLREAPFAQALLKKINKFAIICTLQFRQDKLYINLINQTFIADTKTGKLTEIPQKSSVDFWLEKSGNQFISVAAKHNANFNAITAVRNQPICIHIDENGQTKTVDIPRGGQLIPHPKQICANAGRYGAFSISDKLVKCESGNYSYRQIGRRILSVHIDKDGGLWVGMLKGGVHYFPKGDLSQPPIVSLAGYSVSGILEDAEKNIWCTTLEKGLFFCRNKNVVNYFNIPGLAQPSDMAKSIADAVYLSFGPQITKIKDRQVQQFEVRYYSKETILDIAEYRGQIYISGNEIVARIGPDFQPSTILRLAGINAYMGGYQFQESDGRLYFIYPSAFSEIIGDFVHPLCTMPTRSRCFTPMGGGRFLVGCNDGLYQVDVAGRTTERIPGIIHPVTQILHYGTDFYITTKGGGLYRYDGKKLVSANRKFQIPTLLLFDAVVYKNDLWIGSNIGLIKITPKTPSQAAIFTTANGLPAKEIYKLALCKGDMFLSTVEGICSFEPDVELKNTTPPGIYLKAFFANANQRKTGRKIVLPYNENALRFVFDILSFKASSKLYGHLEGKDGTFKEMPGNEIVFDNLDPGRYKLRAYAKNSDGVKSEEIVVAFEIEQPFWTTFWFLLGCLIVLGLVLYAVIRKIIRNIRARETEKTRINKLIADSQLSALQAQMNPHFIFNSINSIQNYILNQKETEAYDYLAKFSKLVRLVLHNSQEQMLILHDELETVKLYVSLEQMRFSDSFDFALTIDEAVDAYETMVPTMIIQPYLENAIWHGLMNLDGQRRGTIELAISQHGNLLQIAIRDNGIGRKLSAQYGQQNTHRPVAMKLTEQRLKIVNEIYKDNQVRVEITDLYNPDGMASGTLVEIFLPVLNFE